MKHILTSLLLLTMISCDFKSAQDYFNEATKLEEQKKYSEAIILLDKAIEKKPDFLGAIINRGADKSDLKKFDEAIKDFQLVLSFDKKNTLAIFNLANNKKRLKDFGSAVKYYNDALDTKGGQFIMIEAVDNPMFPNDGLSFDVNSSDIIYERALAYYELDSLNNAANDFNHCIANNSYVVDATYYLAQVYFKANRNEEACNFLRKALQMGYKDYLPEQLKVCDK